MYKTQLETIEELHKEWEKAGFSREECTRDVGNYWLKKNSDIQFSNGMFYVGGFAILGGFIIRLLGKIISDKEAKKIGEDIEFFQTVKANIDNAENITKADPDTPDEEDIRG